MDGSQGNGVPTPPSATGTVRWLISSTSPAFSIEPLLRFGKVVAVRHGLLDPRQLRFAPIKFIHRGGAHQPGADAEACRRGFKQIALVFVPGQFAPAITLDFTVQGRAHVTNYVRSHNSLKL